MQSKSDSRSPVASPVAVRISAGIPGLERTYEERLSQRGMVCAPDAPLHLVIDAPVGYAFRVLTAAPPVQPVLVVTANRCAEYLDDLWQLGPAGLLSGTDVEAELLAALPRIATGTRYRVPPAAPARLGKRERAVLRLGDKLCF